MVSAACARQRVHLFCSKVSVWSSAAATVWLRGATLSILAQQHAYITEHVLGVIQCAVFTVERLRAGPEARSGGGGATGTIRPPGGGDGGEVRRGEQEEDRGENACF